MKRSTVIVSTTCLGLLVACAADPPRVTTRWAEKARRVKSEATGSADAEHARAAYGPADDRDEDDLEDLNGETDLGEVVIKLGKGTWLLEEPALLAGATSVTIEGEGAHASRFELQTESAGALMIVDAPKVTLRGVTIIGGNGGGITLKSCPDVVVEDVCFAGARFGLELIGSTASVGTSIFAGCERGVALSKDAKVKVRECAFVECFKGIEGDGEIDVESSAFVDGHHAIDMRLDRKDRLESVLVAGETQTTWNGKPGTLTAAMMNEAGLAKLPDRRPHREINRIDEFPDGLREGAPPGFDLAGVHLAILRADSRHFDDPAKKVRELALERAELHASAARESLTRGDLARARTAAWIALRYCGPGPLADDVPEAVREVAELAVP